MSKFLTLRFLYALTDKDHVQGIHRSLCFDPALCSVYAAFGLCSNVRQKLDAMHRRKPVIRPQKHHDRTEKTGRGRELVSIFKNTADMPTAVRQAFSARLHAPLPVNRAHFLKRASIFLPISMTLCPQTDYSS